MLWRAHDSRRAVARIGGTFRVCAIANEREFGSGRPGESERTANSCEHEPKATRFASTTPSSWRGMQIRRTKLSHSVRIESGRGPLPDSHS